VGQAGLHVDPLCLGCRVLIDATGHDASVLRGLQRKIPGARLDSPTGEVMGERPMNSALGEGQIVELTREVYPQVIVAGMAANAVAGACRMGAVFGGMFLSGQKAAGLALAKLS
jgi:thiamine thiazole synthase